MLWLRATLQFAEAYPLGKHWMYEWCDTVRNSHAVDGYRIEVQQPPTGATSQHNMGARLTFSAPITVSSLLCQAETSRIFAVDSCVAVVQGCYTRRHLWQFAAMRHMKYCEMHLVEQYLGQAVPPRPRSLPPDELPNFDDWAVGTLYESAGHLV